MHHHPPYNYRQTIKNAHTCNEVEDAVAIHHSFNQFKAISAYLNFWSEINLCFLYYKT